MIYNLYLVGSLILLGDKLILTYKFTYIVCILQREQNERIVLRDDTVPLGEIGADYTYAENWFLKICDI